MAKRYTTDEVVAMMSAPSPNVEMLEQPASPFLDPAQINAAERELSQPPPEIPRPETIGTGITDAAGLDRPAAGTSGNMALQNYEAQEAFPIDQTPAPQRPAGGSPTLYPSAEETKPSLPKQRYTTDEVMSLYMQQSKPRYSTKDVMLKMVQPLDDPTLPRLGRDEYFKAKEIKKSLQESGDLPSDWEETKTAVGGFLLTVPDAFATALYKTDKSQGWFEIGGAGFNPALALSETWRRSPATLAYASEMARQGYAGMAEGLRVMGGPKYRVAETGEFVMDDEGSAGGQFGQIDPRNIVDRYKAKGLTLRPVNDEDKKDFEYQQWNKKMDRDLQVERARTAEMPPEFAYRMLVGSAAAVSDYNTGRNDFANITGNVGPMQSQAVVGSMLVDPLTYTTFGAAATRIGISAAAKGATARSLDIIGRAVNKAVKPAEVPLTQIDRFRKIVMPPAKVAGAYGLAAGASYAADVMQLPPELKTAAYTAASLYTAYRGGLGVLRFVGKRFPEASVILRESADPTNGLDIAARKVVASNPNVPSNVRARLERPSQFLSMESTPQRLSQNMALSPGTRKMMEKLSNWYVVQGVRGASDVATGAVKGAIVAAPFAELTRLGGDERAADAMYGIGPALGALGGAANRVFGARGRTIGRAESDIGRMLVDVQAGNTELRSKIGADGKAALQSWNFYNSEIGRMLTDVELAAGDVNALVKNRSFDELARIAAMQGFFRNKVDYIPLGAADFALNAEQHGADGSAGFFLSVPDSERARIFVNVDARRADVEPHEFGEAFFSTGAFSPEQMAAMRSGVDARYGLDGVQRRANEYAESLIRASNATNFPNEKLVISAEQIQAKVNELAQAELQRGGNDPLDWVRREIMVEEWRMAGMDFASIRRNIPEGANPVKFIEDVLGANARALGLSGVRVDPETGIPITPEQLFRENPVAADDPVVMSNLKAYTKAYRAWLNDPAHEVPSGVKIAPDGRAESLANNPNVIFDANGQNPLATRDPQTGQVQWKSDGDRAKEAKVRGQQIRNVAGRDLVAPGSPQFGPKKTANGRIRISGRRLPAALELQKHWKPQLDKIRRLEALADGDESTQVLYVAMGNSADKVKTSRPQDIVAINREMVFDEWVVQGKNNDLYGQFLDLTTIRNRAMRAISERNPALDPANGGPGYSLQAVMDDVYQWMADKRANKDGAATIGADRKNVVNALINPGTNLNREKNPIAGAFGRGSAIKTLLVDNIMAVSGTGRKGAAMDYNWANGNFMPDKPAPRPDMDGDLAPPRAQMMADKAPDVVDADAVGLRSAKFLEQAVGDGMENLRAKQAKRPGTGVAKNKFVRFHDAQGRPIYIGALKKDGGKSFNAWIEETEAWQSPQETAAYRQWYRELKGYFTQIFGERAGEMMMAWLAAQQNVSPGGALGNVFKVEDRLAGIGTGKKGGLADAKIEGVLLGQVPEGGFGPKLTDFVDAGFLREFRTYMASQPEGGRPFVADVHTGRDSGHVDQQTLTRLKERSDNGDLFIDGKPARVRVTQTKTVKQGSKTVIVPERVRVIPQGGKGFDVSVDMRGSPGGPKYEGISEWGNAMTDHLNNIGWRGGEWTPAEVQAVGWMRVLRQYGLPEPTVLSALQQNTSRVFAEVNYSSGNLLPANYPAFDTLSPDVQRAITTDVITQTVNELAPMIGGSLRVQRVSTGTGVWGNMRSPTTVVEVLGSSEAADIFGLALATASEQAATMSTVIGVGGKDSRVLMFKKADGGSFSDVEMQSIIDDAGISGFTMQQLPSGDSGLIADATKDFTPKGLTEKRAQAAIKKLVEWSEKTGIKVEVKDASARVTSYGNDWKTNTDGQRYLSALVQRGGSSRVRDIVRFRGRYAEILREAYERHAPEAVVATPQEQIGPIRQAAESPPLEILEMLRGA